MSENLLSREENSEKKGIPCVTRREKHPKKRTPLSNGGGLPNEG